MFRLTIIYTNAHVVVTYHKTKKEALEYINNEGDDVEEYKIAEYLGNDSNNPVS